MLGYMVYENIISNNKAEGISINEYKFNKNEIYHNIIDNNPIGIRTYYLNNIDLFGYYPTSDSILIYENQISNSSEVGIKNIINYASNSKIVNNTFFNNNTTLVLFSDECKPEDDEVVPEGYFITKIYNNNFYANTNTNLGVKNLAPEDINLTNNFCGITT